MSTTETTLVISNMSCQHCVRSVDALLRAIPGVRVARVDVGSAVIATDGPPPLDAIRQTMQAEGYPVA